MGKNTQLWPLNIRYTLIDWPIIVDYFFIKYINEGRITKCVAKYCNKIVFINQLSLQSNSKYVEYWSVYVKQTKLSNDLVNVTIPIIMP